MGVPISLVDAFSDSPFTGNPAGVCVLTAEREEEWMQRVAMEMNQAETAFVRPLSGEGQYALRWFTPTVEVDLCGHATLATAHVLFSSGVSHEELRFRTKSGVLTARRKDEEIELDFPAEAPTAADLPVDLGLEAVWTGRNRMDWFVQVASSDQVRQLRPDFARIATLGMRGLIVTAADGDYDFVSRCFFPQSGVDEDPVTGSAHCALAPFWAARLGRPELVGYQASRRGGVVQVEALGERVKLRGRAVTTVSGELLV